MDEDETIISEGGDDISMDFPDDTEDQEIISDVEDKPESEPAKTSTQAV
jgi:hypothetical protein